VESKNTNSYVRERRKGNKNIRYTMNVISLSALLKCDLKMAEF